MFIEERHKAILELLAQNGSITTGNIQEKFNVSYDSAKRDLRILEEKGKLTRTHGGALAVHQIALGKPAGVTCKDISTVKPNYLAIAKKAVSMINDKDVVFITPATVGYFMVQNIPEDVTIRVVTNSIIVAEELRCKNNVSVIMLGGEMDNKGNCYDSLAIETARRLRIDKAFVTASCISAEFGLSMQKSQSIAFWNAVMDSSKNVIGLFPVEKVGFESVVSVCPPQRLDTLITDWETSEEELEKFQDLGLETVVVSES